MEIDEYKVKPTTITWKYPTSYTVALLSWTMGLTNIFYNPTILLKIGFFNYLLVHTLIMVIIGIPMTLIELSISQYSLKSVVRCWDMCPFFRGIGYGKVILIVIFQIYYNVLNSYLLFYCFSPIPENTNFRTSDTRMLNGTFNYGKLENPYKGYKYKTNTEEFWYNEVLQSSDQINMLVLDWPNWKLLASFCGHMFLVFIFNVKGTAILETMLPCCFNFSTLEYLVLFCVTNTTPGGIEGIKYMILKNVNLNNLLMWRKEGIVLKIFQHYIYSMGLALGGFSSIASQGTFRKPVYAMSVWVNLANLGTSLMYGFLIANMYGILQFRTNINMEDILITENRIFDFDHFFTVLPNALRCLPGLHQVWIFIFYSSIYLKGLCTSSLMASTVLNVFYEENYELSRHTQIWSFLFCIFITLPGCLLHSNFGPTVGQFLSNLTMKVLVLLILTCEVVAVIFIYGLLRFMKDLHFMLGTYPTVYWPLCLIISIFVVPTLTVMSLIIYFKDTILTEFEVILLKAALSFVLVWIPFMCMVRVIRKVKFKLILNSASNWGPANGLKKSRRMFEEQHCVQEFLYDKYLLEQKLQKYN